VIKRVRERKPEVYLASVVSLLPKQSQIERRSPLNSHFDTTSQNGEVSADAAPVPPGRRPRVGSVLPTPSSGSGQVRDEARLLTRENLDKRTKASRQFDAIARGIASDLGGEAQLSTVQKHLVEAFAGAAIHVQDKNARLLLGEEVDIVEHCQAISTLVRVAQRIGLRRVARNITPDLSNYLARRAHDDIEVGAE
jgi:hypothetical protein